VVHGFLNFTPEGDDTSGVYKTYFLQYTSGAFHIGLSSFLKGMSPIFSAEFLIDFLIVAFIFHELINNCPTRSLFGIRA
jgi:hypothetical protein